jgi:hypothetical protein
MTVNQFDSDTKFRWGDFQEGTIKRSGKTNRGSEQFFTAAKASASRLSPKEW